MGIINNMAKSESVYTSINVKVFFLLLFSLCYYLAPVTFSFFILLMSVFFDKKIYKLLCVLLASISFGLISYTKVPHSDLLVYYDIYRNLNGINFSQIFIEHKLEPVFFIISWVLSNISDGFEPLFIFFWVSYSYTMMLFAIHYLFKQTSYSTYIKFILAFLLIYIFYIGYDLSMVNHLVRQYAAYSTLSLALALFVFSRNKEGCFLLALAFLIHTSIVLFFPLCFLICTINRLSSSNLFIYMMIAILSVAIGSNDLLQYMSNMPSLGLNYLDNIKGKFTGYEYAIDGTFNMFSFVGKYFLIIYALLHSALMKNKTEVDSKIFIILFYFVIGVLMFRNTDILLIRFSFSITLVFVFAVFYLSDKKGKEYFFLIIAIYGIFAPIRFLRALTSEAGNVYIDDTWAIFFYPIHYFLN